MTKMRMLREIQGWSQADIAGFLGISPTQYGRYERLEVVPPQHLSRKFVKFYGKGWTLARLLQPSNSTDPPQHGRRRIADGKVIHLESYRDCRDILTRFVEEMERS